MMHKLKAVSINIRVACGYSETPLNLTFEHHSNHFRDREACTNAIKQFNEHFNISLDER